MRLKRISNRKDKSFGPESWVNVHRQKKELSWMGAVSVADVFDFYPWESGTPRYGGRQDMSDLVHCVLQLNSF